MPRSSPLPAPHSPLLCDACATPLLLAGPNALAVGRCAPCVKRIALAAKPQRSFQSLCRQGEGLVVNGTTIPARGICACGGKLYSRTEAAEGVCVDCSIAEQRKALAQIEAERDKRTNAEYRDDVMHDAEERARSGACDEVAL